MSFMKPSKNHLVVFFMLIFLGGTVGSFLFTRWESSVPTTTTLQSSTPQNNTSIFNTLPNALKIPNAFSVSPPSSFSELIKKVQAAVVNISTTTEVRVKPYSPWGGVDPFFRDFFSPYQQQRSSPQTKEAHSLGTGFIINEEGDILTNNHVVEGADQIVAKLEDGRELEVKIVGRDPRLDIAVLKPLKQDKYPSIPLGNSDALEVGDWVVAIGNPFGLGHTVTAGIVSAKARVIGAGPYDDFIQTDASINPGNSGGPLFNTQGEVVGINTAIIASGQGIGFATPINMAKEILPQLITKGEVSRGWLGISIVELTLVQAKKLGLTDLKGAYVGEVVEGSPAGRAGIQSGDMIVEFNDQSVDHSRTLPTLVAKLPPGSQAKIIFLHDGKRFEQTVTLGSLEHPEASLTTPETKHEKGILGMALRDLTASEKQRIGNGVVVIQITPGSMADSIGIQSRDLLLELNSQAISNLAEFKGMLNKIRSGTVIRLALARGSHMYYFAFRKE